MKNREIILLPFIFLFLKFYVRGRMVFAHGQFIILNLFGAASSFYFFNNNTITILSLESKQSESLI
jgi:hypothetical protein